MEATEATISGTARRRRSNLTGVSEADVSLGGIALLVVDPQMDFHEGGSLAVPGASADAVRIARLIVDHSNDIDELVVTLDSHHVSATTLDCPRGQLATYLCDTLLARVGVLSVYYYYSKCRLR